MKTMVHWKDTSQKWYFKHMQGKLRVFTDSLDTNLSGNHLRYVSDSVEVLQT